MKSYFITQPSRGSAGISLVEVLAAIAIIAILGAVIIPLFGNIRAQSQSAGCLNNLRLIGSALQMYHNDKGGVLPSMVVARDSIESPEPALDTELEPYVDSLRIFRCPADDQGLFTRTGSSYGWNFLINGQTLSQIVLQLSEDNPIASDPTRIPMVFDQEGFHRRSGGSVNYLYADGSSTHELHPFAE